MRWNCHLLAAETCRHKPGTNVGIVGLGGLGHTGVKLAAAFGANVFVFTTSSSKAADAKRLGAHEVVNSRNDGETQKHLNRFDFIIDLFPPGTRSLPVSIS